MNSEKLKSEIIIVFQRNRQTPNTYYDESRFLDYLLNPPTTKNNIKNSFKGVRRYYRFFEDIELTFGICFSLSDQDRFHSIEQFVKKTNERIRKGRGNKQIIQRRLEEKEHYYVELLLTAVLAIIVFFLGIHIITILALIGYGIAIWWIVSSKLRDKRHNKKLNEVINS
ncbi:hypothetical protein E1176_08025 [Fulvivirga sp. RKSG066]|uniref:hypothetical protein n=1 Tax=Fulvivirga aurantia TaxID=2529383 RepID=UPI0012BD2F91|nr:hypothetical protein [Fulvivirga aurantia]MTI20966.1 hypothetical protein [Fulvivirga aurantia]